MVTVEQPVTGVYLNKSQLKMIKGDTERLKATIIPEDATNKNLIWESDDRSVATVVNGNVTAVGAGVTTIVVKAADGDGTPLAHCTVWVVEKSVSLNQTKINMLVGDIRVLKATVFPPNAGVIWKSQDNNIATVVNGGVEAKALGSTTITVSLSTDPDVNATCIVTVTDKAVSAQSISLNKTATRIIIGGTDELIATVLPEDTTDDKALRWTSDKPGVATVDQNGVVRGISAGTAAVKVALANKPSISATCTVRVTDPDNPKDPDPVVSGDGTTSIEVTKNGIIWLKEESNGTSTWYGLDNTNGVFEYGSIFWVRWLTREEDPKTWQEYWDQVDDNHKNSIEADRVNVFLVGVTAPDGTPYRTFAAVPLYVEIGTDWDKDDIRSIFISSGEDEVIAAAFIDNMQYPEGQGIFAQLTLHHFSPYLVYDVDTGTLVPPQGGGTTDNPKDPGNNNLGNYLDNYLKTGDSFSYILVSVLGIVLVLSLIVMFKSKKNDK